MTELKSPSVPEQQLNLEDEASDFVKLLDKAALERVFGQVEFRTNSPAAKEELDNGKVDDAITFAFDDGGNVVSLGHFSIHDEESNTYHLLRIIDVQKGTIHALRDKWDKLYKEVVERGYVGLSILDPEKESQLTTQRGLDTLFVGFDGPKNAFNVEVSRRFPDVADSLLNTYIESGFNESDVFILKKLDN